LGITSKQAIMMNEEKIEQCGILRMAEAIKGSRDGIFYRD
jgi:hypothetical protein